MQNEGLNELNQLLATVTQQEVDHRASDLCDVQEGETTIGTIHNEELKRLWAVSQRQRYRAKEYAVKSAGALNQEDADEFMRESQKADCLEDLAKELFWTQTRYDLGHWRDNIGLRKDWMAVEPRLQPQIRGGIIEMPAGSASDVLRALFGERGPKP